MSKNYGRWRHWGTCQRLVRSLHFLRSRHAQCCICLDYPRNRTMNQRNRIIIHKSPKVDEPNLPLRSTLLLRVANKPFPNSQVQYTPCDVTINYCNAQTKSPLQKLCIHVLISLKYDERPSRELHRRWEELQLESDRNNDEIHHSSPSCIHSQQWELDPYASQIVHSVMQNRLYRSPPRNLAIACMQQQELKCWFPLLFTTQRSPQYTSDQFDNRKAHNN